MDAAVVELLGDTALGPWGPVVMKTSRSFRPGNSEPLMLTTLALTLTQLRLKTNYRSLSPFERNFHPAEQQPTGANPICLVGLNGSGKSNLIEAIAEIFCFLELINLPWRKVESRSSRYRENDHIFELEYRIQDADGEHHVRIRKLKRSGPEFYEVLSDGREREVLPGLTQLKLLPRRIIGYSSGLNETVSYPFSEQRQSIQRKFGMQRQPTGNRAQATERLRTRARSTWITSPTPQSSSPTTSFRAREFEGV